MTKDQIILDDGTFFIELNCNHEAGDAPGFLNRRCAHGPTTPGGYECVGSFDKASKGRWNASVDTRYDPATDSDSRLVSTGTYRLGAIIALWQARHDAYTTKA